MELIVQYVKRSSASCRVRGGTEERTLHLTHRWDVVPGELAVVEPAREWVDAAGVRHVAGPITTRVEPAALGLPPLAVTDYGLLDPATTYWGESGTPLEDWAAAAIAGGPRRQFEMEQILPGIEDPDDPFDDPIVRAMDMREEGRAAAAYNALMQLCRTDLRCLDAHAHLGNLVFDRNPARALRHYEVGVRIGDWSLGPGFDGLLTWGFIDNRPFLRCLYNGGLCLWRLRRFEAAERVFRRLLWLNPDDDQGSRFSLYAVRTRTRWRAG